MKKLLLTIMALALLVLSGCEDYSQVPPGKNIEINSFEECIAAGNPAMESYPRQCQANGETFVEIIEEDLPLIGGDKDEYGCLVAAGFQWCLSTEKCQRMWEEYCEEYKEVYREPVACTREYMPVCGTIEIQCITTPCDPIEETFSNNCLAEAAGATDITEGACEEKTKTGGTLLELCMVTQGANWVEEAEECEFIGQEACEEVGGTFNECGSACRNDPDAEICTMQCVPYCVVE